MTDHTKALADALVRIKAAGDPARLSPEDHAKFCKDAHIVQSWCNADGLRKLLALIPTQPAPSLTVGDAPTALEQFNANEYAAAEPDPVERLRFFCSLAMQPQDWLDVEQFFEAIKPAAQAEPVAWRYRHILNTLNPAAPEAITEWRPVEPRDCLQTLEQRIAELRAYRYDGRPCYEVQALYAAPPSNPPAQGAGELPPLPDWSARYRFEPPPDGYAFNKEQFTIVRELSQEKRVDLFTADQMQAYARAALAQQKEQA